MWIYNDNNNNSNSINNNNINEPTATCSRSLVVANISVLVATWAPYRDPRDYILLYLKLFLYLNRVTNNII